MAKIALCVGINDYPGTNNDLNGCVNDANDWADLLRNVFNFNQVNVITNANATSQNILLGLTNLVSNAQAGDVIAFTYSGHGTWVPDNLDLDEADNRDEAICAYDRNIIDDELRTIIRRINHQTLLTVISDSCYSGSITRAMIRRETNFKTFLGDNKENYSYIQKPRFMPPENTDARLDRLPIRRILFPEEGMPEILLTGCNSTELSYDAFINGRYNGAMTATALRVIRQDPNQSYADFLRRLRMLLPSTQYPQSPQLEGSANNKLRRLFT